MEDFPIIGCFAAFVHKHPINCYHNSSLFDILGVYLSDPNCSQVLKDTFPFAPSLVSPHGKEAAPVQREIPVNSNLPPTPTMTNSVQEIENPLKRQLPQTWIESNPEVKKIKPNNPPGTVVYPQFFLDGPLLQTVPHDTKYYQTQDRIRREIETFSFYSFVSYGTDINADVPHKKLFEKIRLLDPEEHYFGWSGTSTMTQTEALLSKIQSDYKNWRKIRNKSLLSVATAFLQSNPNAYWVCDVGFAVSETRWWMTKAGIAAPPLPAALELIEYAVNEMIELLKLKLPGPNYTLKKNQIFKKIRLYTPPSLAAELHKIPAPNIQNLIHHDG